ncbi:MAG: twin-arginine translocation signal domain-containing protein [Xanthobacteraceae bacterium]|nr:MAG: twin-arginine translocation signal domain-containing protein [Xanthobacteraceae bacterium]
MSNTRNNSQNNTLAHLSRRSLLKDGTAALGVGAILGATVQAKRAEAAKVSQQMATYQNSPKGEGRCEVCSHFQPPSSCQIVDGTISPNGWCKYFLKKS